MKVLVTGGAGYIGSHVVKALLSQGHQLTVIDNLSTGRRSSVLGGEFVEGDIGDLALLEKVLNHGKFEACLHFAGSIVVPESVSEPAKYYENNTSKSLGLIDLCTKYGVKNFIFSSTAAVYGLLESGLCSEDSPVAPINPYGRSKLMTELVLEDISKAKGLKYIALRYFNVAGANVDGLLGQCTPNATHLIKIASEVATGKRSSMQVFGEDYKTPDGTCVRDYIHVDDLAAAHVDALHYLRDGGESAVLNCGYGHGTSVKEVLAVVEKVTGKKLPVTTGPRREGDAPSLVAVSERIRETIGWTPKYDDLELIVKTAIEWEKKL